MKKLTTLAILIAVAGLVSINAYAHNHDFTGFGGFSPFGGYGYGYGFGGYGMNYTAFGGFGYGMEFDGRFGFGHDMAFDGHFGGGFGGFGMDFASFGGFDFNRYAVNRTSSRKIVPIPATASVNTSITYDENGEIHVRPFDDEDLFVED